MACLALGARRRCANAEPACCARPRRSEAAAAVGGTPHAAAETSSARRRSSMQISACGEEPPLEHSELATQLGGQRSCPRRVEVPDRLDLLQPLVGIDAQQLVQMPAPIDSPSSLRTTQLRRRPIAVSTAATCAVAAAVDPFDDARSRRPRHTAGVRRYCGTVDGEEPRRSWLERLDVAGAGTREAESGDATSFASGTKTMRAAGSSLGAVISTIAVAIA
jgi:hypothetical protein